ncbi:MAG: hypothetical protein ACIAQU_03585, partial [Phycisphaerales bacterium JB064]
AHRRRELARGDPVPVHAARGLNVFWQSTDWLVRLENDRGSVERDFEKSYGYPLPWCEVATAEDVEQLSWRLSECAGMRPPTINITTALSHLWHRMSAGRSAERGVFPGHPERDYEAIESAIARLAVPLDGVVLLVASSHQDEGSSGQRALRIRMKSVVDSVFWNEDVFVIDQDAQWVLVSMHTWPALLWRK